VLGIPTQMVLYTAAANLFRCGPLVREGIIVPEPSAAALLFLGRLYRGLVRPPKAPKLIPLKRDNLWLGSPRKVAESAIQAVACPNLANSEVFGFHPAEYEDANVPKSDSGAGRLWQRLGQTGGGSGHPGLRGEEGGGTGAQAVPVSPARICPPCCARRIWITTSIGRSSSGTSRRCGRRMICRFARSSSTLAISIKSRCESSGIQPSRISNRFGSRRIFSTTAP